MIEELFYVTMAMFFGGGFKAWMDKLTFHPHTIIGKLNDWYNSPFETWQNKNKYKNRFIRFLFRTAFVGATDAWHCMQTGFNFCIVILAVITSARFGYYMPQPGFKYLLLLLIPISAYYLSFNLFFKFILDKRFWKKHGTV